MHAIRRNPALWGFEKACSKHHRACNSSALCGVSSSEAVAVLVVWGLLARASGRRGCARQAGRHCCARACFMVVPFSVEERLACMCMCMRMCCW